jgi:hypothetical protein
MYNFLFARQLCISIWVRNSLIPYLF